MANFNTDYYRTMDSEYVSAPDREYPELGEKIEAKKEDLGLGPAQIGIGTNPFTHPTKGVEARLHDGAKKMEITFMGQGKGNKDRFTPESISKEERQELRDLMEINKTKLTTHATPDVVGLAGFTEKGFDDRARDRSMREINKAIDFAADASTGGAIVFHTGEWQRPISEQKFAKDNGYTFKGYSSEDEKAAFYTVDKDTGQISGIRKDQKVYEPKFHTVRTFAKDKGYHKDSRGNYVDDNGNIVFELVGHDDDKNHTPIYKDTTKNDKVYEDEWVDAEGRFISPDPKKTERWFDRVPQWNADKTNFEVEPLEYGALVKRSEKFKRRHSIDLKPEELYVRTQISNQVLQAKGQSLYHAKMYEEHKFRRDKLKEALEYYKQLDDNLDEKEKWRLMQKRESRFESAKYDINPTEESIVEALNRKLRFEENEMRHIHESSAAADAKAREARDKIENIQNIHDYGIDKTAESIAELGGKVYRKNKHKREGMDDLYLAPENWQPEQFGGHPEEMTEIVQRARERFIEKNRNQFESKEEAKKAAQNVIKSTIDIGHLNQWKRHFERKKRESDEQHTKRFNKWAIKEIEKMHDAGVLGHFHLADNFGYDDEHLTPGQGSAPIKEFVKMLKKKGYDDFIVEGGSFNPVSALPDTWSYFGANVSKSGYPRKTFDNVHQQHFKYKSSPLYIAGAYAPSNEFKMFSEVPLH